MLLLISLILFSLAVLAPVISVDALLVEEWKGICGVIKSISNSILILSFYLNTKSNLSIQCVRYLTYTVLVLLKGDNGSGNTQLGTQPVG